MKKILILGSEGFIGNNCVKYFANKGYKVYGCDLLDYSRQDYNYTKLSRLQPLYDELFYDLKYDLCINASGNGSVPISLEHPATDFEANCSDVFKILDLIRLKNAECKYIHISSAAVYGNPQILPVSEQEALKPLSPYGWHKKISENLCEEYYSLYNMKIAIVRPFSIYGPGLKKQLFWDLYQKSKKVTNEIELWGTGKESRDFIYIDDLMYALDIILTSSPMEGNIYNLANGVEITIKDATQQFIDSLEINLHFKFNFSQRLGDPVNWKADISKIVALGYKPSHNFSMGIKKTAQWLKDVF